MSPFPAQILLGAGGGSCTPFFGYSLRVGEPLLSGGVPLRHHPIHGIPGAGIGTGEWRGGPPNGASGGPSPLPFSDGQCLQCRRELSFSLLEWREYMEVKSRAVLSPICSVGFCTPRGERL